LGAEGLALIPADLIDTWEHKDRTLPEIEDDPEFYELIERIKATGGNIEPIKIRPNKQKPGRYEEIFGFKRHQACKRLGLSVLAIVEDLDDAQAFRQMVAENSGRSQVSAWRKAISWSNALKAGLVTSVEQLALEVGKDPRTVQSYLRVVEIMDNELISRLKMHMLGIQPLFEIRAGLLAFKDDPEKRQEFIDRLIEKADIIDEGKATPAMITKLVASISGTAVKAPEAREVVSSSGAKLLSIKTSKQGYAVKVHFAASKVLDPDDVEKLLTEALAKKGLLND
jgi:ParB/RepB/Spo0J family partition protein